MGKRKRERRERERQSERDKRWEKGSNSRDNPLQLHDTDSESSQEVVEVSPGGGKLFQINLHHHGDLGDLAYYGGEVQRRIYHIGEIEMSNLDTWCRRLYGGKAIVDYHWCPKGIEYRDGIKAINHEQDFREMAVTGLKAGSVEVYVREYSVKDIKELHEKIKLDLEPPPLPPSTVVIEELVDPEAGPGVEVNIPVQDQGPPVILPEIEGVLLIEWHGNNVQAPVIDALEPEDAVAGLEEGVQAAVVDVVQEGLDEVQEGLDEVQEGLDEAQEGLAEGLNLNEHEEVVGTEKESEARLEEVTEEGEVPEGGPDCPPSTLERMAQGLFDDMAEELEGMEGLFDDDDQNEVQAEEHSGQRGKNEGEKPTLDDVELNVEDYIVDPDYDIWDDDDDLITELRSTGQYFEEGPDAQHEDDVDVGSSQRSGGRPRGESQAEFRPGGVDRTIHPEADDQEEEVDSDYIASDDNNTASESDGDGRVKFRMFNEEKEMENPTFKNGLQFVNREQFKKACRQWGIKHRYQLHFPVNEKTRVRAKCFDKSDNVPKCRFEIFASKQNMSDPDDETFLVKTLNLVHTCPKRRSNFHMTSAYLAESFLEEFRANPDYNPEQFVAKIARELKQKISVQTARRARLRAVRKLEGDEDGQYAKLYDYRREVLRTNPGSTVDFKEPRGKFAGMYMCLAGMKNAFRNGLRQIVCLDGCWLKGKYGGQLLSATGIDPNDCMYPLAMAWVKVENTENWTWFLELLKADLHLGNRTTFMSDKQKGLIHALDALFPHSEHRYCWRHLWANFRTTFHLQHLKPLIWNIGIATYTSKLNAAMKVLENTHTAGYNWIEERSREHWSRAHFRPQVKCDILLNNLAEAFNKYVLTSRTRPILTMFEMIRTQLMRRIHDKQIFGSKINSRLCPKIRKKLDKIIEEGWNYTAHPAGSPQVQVIGPGGQFVVNLDERTCTCRRWDLTGIPCVHACPCIYENNEVPENYVDDCYTKATYQKVYSYVINPLNGADMWETDPNPFHIIVPPSPVQTKKRGRKSTVRRKEAEELEQQHEQTVQEAHAKRAKLGRKGLQKVKCSECNRFGHNKRTCKKDNDQAACGGDTQPEARAAGDETGGEAPDAGEVPGGEFGTGEQAPTGESGVHLSGAYSATEQASVEQQGAGEPSHDTSTQAARAAKRKGKRPAGREVPSRYRDCLRKRTTNK
ncbi:uncharacterized protein LOC126667282 [Mercurialis annua]|uniref:uncharacterized protein LOC126667282 n=1 Tax=Mercurialis annua TaxID=3986 RepID=UPI002160FFE4|nr:uncharacterized protein LOC126667282 [Mercurialis annua]